MDYGYSPSREGGTMHFPSPTHPHSYRLDGAHFSHLQELRRSLSRSPSKQSRFQLRNSDTPRSPISPLAIARAFSPKAHKPSSPIATFFPESPLAQAAPAKKKFSLRRPAGPFRSSPRTRNSNSKSPRRRALADSPDAGNATPFLARSTAGMENTPARRPSAESPDTMDMDKRLEVNDKPIKFEFARRPDLSPLPPAKSSPLKRNDGLMNLSGSPGSSPMAKRRSLHGVPSLGNDFESIFDPTPSLRLSGEETSPNKYNNDANNAFSFNSSPITTTTPTSPVRRATSLRRSTLSQRSSTPRKPDGEFAMPGAAASKTRNRMSLDSSMNPPTSLSAQTPFRKSTFDAGRMGLPQPFSRAAPGAPQPHPLSHAHTPSSTSSYSSGTPMAPPRAPAIQWSGPAFAPPTNPGTNPLFSRSLPIGIGRPHAEDGEECSQDSFDTPFKGVQHPPVAFSTGLLSKKNRNADEPAAGGIYVMPDTPSKRQSFPPAAADRSLNLDTPLVKRSGSLFGNDARPPQHQFGTPSTPFSANVSKFSTDSFGKRPSIFGDMGNTMQRRGSFVSIDGDHDDDTQPDAQSPTANRMGDSQSSADDMPPTPTKPSGGSSRRSKESSLRRKTFRSRPSIGTDTFAIPDNDGRPTSKCPSHPDPKTFPGKDSSSDDDESKPTVDKSPSARALDVSQSRLLRHTMDIGRPLPLSRRVARTSTQSSDAENSTKQPLAAGSLFGTPQTPANDTFGPPDASKLSISGNRRGSFPFNSSFGSCAPATPTTPRDSGYFGGVGAIPIGLTKNDVDESLSERFHEIKPLDGGEGEFSTVYRVSKPVEVSPLRSPAGSQVWVVKKSKKQYIGAGDRQKKMREVEILYALRGNEHVLGIKTHWEFNQHLYIQTEYCEGGNLRKYLDNVGFNSRLDDFRIWKILLELLSGLKSIHDAGYIHLDLKPANVLIDFEGGLKIADFGLASQWPAPPGIDGEGDRHYLAPEQLSGRFDKPADIFALGMMLAEIAGNCVIPENGDYWQKLRSGEFATVLPSLTWSAESTLSRDLHGDPVPENTRPSMDGFLMSDADEDPIAAIMVKPASPEEELARAPSFMIDRSDPNCMDEVVYAMLHRDPDMRPTADDVLTCYGCRWVDARRRSGATVYEGNFGPSDEILATYASDEDMMDMS